MFIINQSGEWAVNKDQVSVIKQTPCDKGSTGIRVTVGANEFLLATYANKQIAGVQYKELLRVCMISDKPTYQLPKDVG